MTGPDRQQHDPTFLEESALFADTGRRGGRRWRRRRTATAPPAEVERIRAPLRRSRRVVIASRKGGVGKTTTALMLGHTFAAHRLDRVVAIDGDPEGGTLAHRVPGRTGPGIDDLLADMRDVRGYTALRRFTIQTPTGLEVLAAPATPDSTRRWHASEYLRVVAKLTSSYGLVLLDTGTGVLDGVTAGLLEAADQLVLVVGDGLDEARAASTTLDWLEGQGSHRLVADAVTVITASWPLPGRDTSPLVEWFGQRCRAVCEIPFDPHLERGAITDPDRLQPATRTAYLHLAAAVADGFALDGARRTAPPPPDLTRPGGGPGPMPDVPPGPGR